jgi:hypothetical protein
MAFTMKTEGSMTGTSVVKGSAEWIRVIRSSRILRRREFIAGAEKFVTMANIENFPEAIVRIEAHAILIGNGNENEIEKFFQTRQSLVESLPKEPMIDPTERTIDESNAIRLRRLRSFVEHVQLHVLC